MLESSGRPFHHYHAQDAKGRDAQDDPYQVCYHGFLALVPPRIRYRVSPGRLLRGDLLETDKNRLLRCNSATVIIVPRSAGVSAPGIPTAFIKAAIAAQGKSLAYKDSLAFPTRKST